MGANNDGAIRSLRSAFEFGDLRNIRIRRDRGGGMKLAVNHSRTR
jgi:hypothetical protein